MLELVLFSLFVATGAYAIHQRNGRISAEKGLMIETRMTETLGRLNGQLRGRLEVAERALADCGGPGPRSTIRRATGVRET